MAPLSDLRLLYIARYLRKNPIYILHNLLDLCRCLKIHLSTNHTHLLSQKPSTHPAATKMALRLLRNTVAAQAGIQMSTATADPRKLAMHVSCPKPIFSVQSTIVLGTVAVLRQLRV